MYFASLSEPYTRVMFFFLFFFCLSKNILHCSTYTCTYENARLKKRNLTLNVERVCIGGGGG